MTNEQKAREIAEYLNQSNGSNSLLECHQAAMAIAQYKDEQEIEFLQSLMFQSATQNIFDKINERIKLLKGE
jgi:hypothetical protein